MTRDKTLRQKEIAKAFSNGNFELAYPYLAETVEWHIIGEGSFSGKQAVIENCEQTAAYFKLVKTDFRTFNVIADLNQVAITGTASFTQKDEKITYVSACDVYEFNVSNELQTINSYCITQKNEFHVESESNN